MPSTIADTGGIRVLFHVVPLNSPMTYVVGRQGAGNSSQNSDSTSESGRTVP